MSTGYVMKVSSNGQMSIPAETRARWNAERVIVVELGDRIVVRPLPDDPIGALVGRYQGRGPSSDDARRQHRNAESDTEPRTTR